MFNLKLLSKFWKNRNDKKPIRASKDPVCGMKPTDNIHFVYEGVKYSFCSDHCKQQFENNPEAYIIK